MKKLRLYLLFLVRAWAGVAEDYARDLKKFESLVLGCDKVIISAAPSGYESSRCMITIDGVYAVKKVAEQVGISRQLLQHSVVVDHGREIVPRVSCDCFGEGDLLFFQNGIFCVKARIFHWKELKVEPAEGAAFVLDLTGQSKDMENIWNFFFPKITKTANQALVPTPASVTPAADAPVAPDAVAAHL
jgi:hypothetical protein